MPIEMVTKKCCRLCLAPNEECVPIFTNFSADRQRLDHKIFACVRIKVLLEDNLSSKICHACISYLNSWQSFKNRCDTAERKQKCWSQIEGSSEGAEQIPVIQQVRELCPSVTIESISHNVEPHLTNIPVQNSTTIVMSMQNRLGNVPTEQMDLSSIKKEPKDQPDNSNEHASDDNDDDDDVANIQRQMVSACSLCDMTFSNRANARRHERNIHGLRQNPTNPMSAHVPQSVLEFCKSENEIKSNNNTSIMSTSTGAPSIDLKQKFHMKLKSHGDTYDYSNSARYRHLVTPSKLAFILRNLEFLEQAQNMKCRCCNKSYPSYKYFMGHMRKKYQNLPRNVCFKCLRQFSSKGQFIGHLKRKNCINLYAVVMDGGCIASKEPSFTGFPLTKEVIDSKIYGCKLCNKEFNSKVHHRQHVIESHPAQQNSIGNTDTMCTYCLLSFEDALLCQKHNENLECITFIVCCSCGERFEGHTDYVDHVYQHHLPQQQAGHDEYGYELYDHDGTSSSSHLRNPQNCPVCNKQYNNYYNVLRHMESKHPNQLPQIYQCIKCTDGFPRQSELRDHLHSVHGENTPKQQKQPPSSNFPCKECDQSFQIFSDWVEHQNVEHSKFNCLKCDFKSESLESFTVHCFMEHRNYNSSAAKVQLYSCRQCTNSYNSIDSLQDHIESQHTSTLGTTNINIKNPSNVFDNGEIDERNEPVATDNMDSPLTAKTLNCRLCGFLLTDIEALRQHMNKVHGLDKKFFYCNQCTAKFMNDKGLRVHFFRFHGVLDESTLGNAGVSSLNSIQQATSLQCDTELAATSDLECDETDSFECSVCHIVYKTADLLKIHMQKVHPSTVNIRSNEDKETHDSAPNLWFQCRYCTESFNTNKRLSIHMNTHDEHDKSDHSCKDCGGVYSSKKSLWVHRYKKHPKIPDASACDVCSRVFFDKTELFYHTSQAHSNGDFSNVTNGNSQEDFQDMQCATEALCSMLDTSVNTIDESFRRTNSTSEDPVYQCDICPKTFHILNALQVHRGWHFRSPDGRKVRDPNDTWQPDQLPPSKMKKLSYQHRVTSGVTTATVFNDPCVQKVSNTCPYCYSTFASGNNLRRHIVEVHKRNETKSSIQQSPLIDAQTDSKPVIERFRECTTCSLKFTTVPEWFDHKLSHARVQKSSQTFKWCCEICGQAFIRKERLLQHMISHINVKAYDGIVHRTFTEDSKHHEDGAITVSLQSIKSKNKLGTSSSQIKTNESQTKKENEEEDDDDDNIIEAEFLDDGDDDEEEDINNSNDEYASKVTEVEDGSNKTEHYFCELCKVSFNTADSLRQHVSEHFLIGALGGDIKFSRRTSTDTVSSTSSSSSKRNC